MKLLAHLRDTADAQLAQVRETTYLFFSHQNASSTVVMRSLRRITLMCLIYAVYTFFVVGTHLVYAARILRRFSNDEIDDLKR